ncbi:sugar ABC transporter permease [Rubrobacter taiwanensis]|uniref:Sugar ABC transporter permease n=1 Tax=Rubrobacter taiwanensis TaxID=185139 RepID=A0A4V2NX56_9ACTN|nr:sugar ABC transporter permease [Rubrobacter taiwanensis]TCJ19972.1 sugar ABC transporter permease [Rubrobacter taiwanensis]
MSAGTVRYAGYLFILPYLTFLGLFIAYPLGFAVWMSFYDYFFAAPGAVVERPFVGLENYRALILEDGIFHTTLGNIAVFIAVNVPLTTVLAIVLATALNARLPGRTFFRTSYYLPYVTASVAIIAVWGYLFFSDGLVNRVLGDLAPEPSWLVNRTWAMIVVALLVTWKNLGYYVLLYLAALQNIPRQLYEAAEVDGAGVLAKFRHITIPGLRPATVLVVILSTIIGANLFTEPYLLTNGGGPENQTLSPVLYMYQKGIEQADAGYAAAIGVTLSIGVLTIAAVQRFALERD